MISGVGDKQKLPWSDIYFIASTPHVQAHKIQLPMMMNPDSHPASYDQDILYFAVAVWFKDLLSFADLARRCGYGSPRPRRCSLGSPRSSATHPSEPI